MQGETGGRRLRLASTTVGRTAARVDRYAVERSPSAAADQTASAPSKRLVYLPRSTWRSFREQPGGAFDSPRDHHPQNQLLQSQSTRRRCASHSDEHLLHAEKTRSQPREGYSPSSNDVSANWKIAAPAVKPHGK